MKKRDISITTKTCTTTFRFFFNIETSSEFEHSLNMFRADKIVKEADKQTAYVVVAAVAAMVANHMSVRLIISLHSYLRELERYRDIIAAAAERYHSDTTVNL